MGFLKGHSLAAFQEYAFTFNYRVITKDKKVISVLQRSTFFQDSSPNSVLASIGFLMDISNLKEDTKIIFTIEKIDKSYESHSLPPIYKSTFYPDKTYDVLSRREAEVLQCIHEGLSSKQIADKLFVSLNTVNNHRKNMLLKTKTSNTAELLNYSIKHGVI
ncbi:response regulator transcription factor [Rufibacter hautae]|uniref:Response regulator transcription factor n=2 Tax=Rufibacter hautae TaxID=2595005 RepID=A0A5B6TCD4_9BACT|nr:response regulator transcription factor [Rufibacter hautae]